MVNFITKAWEVKYLSKKYRQASSIVRRSYYHDSLTYEQALTALAKVSLLRTKITYATDADAHMIKAWRSQFTQAFNNVKSIQ